MKARFLTPAKLEYLEVIAYYNGEKRGLGYDFVIEVDKAVERICLFPEAWQKVSKRVRRCRLKKFPYGLLYQIRKNEILILSVFHLHRGPKSWRNRLQ